MLVAHLVPGYFCIAAAQKKRLYPLQTTSIVCLWGSALSGCVFPDMDVVVNLLFNGIFGHRFLWTHSLFGPLIVLLIARMLRICIRVQWIVTAVHLFAVGWVSHILLDLLVHGIPLFYPLSRIGFGWAPKSIVVGGLSAYLAHPIFLLEPLLIAAAVAHLLRTRRSPDRGCSPSLLAIGTQCNENRRVLKKGRRVPILQSRR